MCPSQRSSVSLQWSIALPCCSQHYAVNALMAFSNGKQFLIYTVRTGSSDNSILKIISNYHSNNILVTSFPFLFLIPFQIISILLSTSVKKNSTSIPISISINWNITVTNQRQRYHIFLRAHKLLQRATFLLWQHPPQRVHSAIKGSVLGTKTALNSILSRVWQSSEQCTAMRVKWRTRGKKKLSRQVWIRTKPRVWTLSQKPIRCTMENMLRILHIPYSKSMHRYYSVR